VNFSTDTKAGNRGFKKPKKEITMKASTHNAAGIFIYMLLSAGALGWGLVSFHGIDLVSEPFGSMMVLSRTILSLATLTVAYEITRRQAAMASQAVRTRVRGRRQ
jgi:uncharacterized membrane protein YuzA (DUF378 family)